MKKEKILRKIIVDNTSEMLDNPDKSGIYPTTKFYDNLEREIYELFSNKNNSGNMKYKAGDKVKLKNRRGKLWNPDGEMDKYIGKTVTIISCDDGTFSINDGSEWLFSFDDIEKLVSRQFTKSDLKDNHIVVYENGLKEIWGKNTNKSMLKEDLTRSHKIYTEVIEVWEFDKLVWKREEKPVEILDKVEKKYLSYFIKPFKNRVIEIILKKGFENKQYIIIRIKGEDPIYLPYFKPNTMYKGMELNKQYTLEELGLEQ